MPYGLSRVAHGSRQGRDGSRAPGRLGRGRRPDPFRRQPEGFAVLPLEPLPMCGQGCVVGAVEPEEPDEPGDPLGGVVVDPLELLVDAVGVALVGGAPGLVA